MCYLPIVKMKKKKNSTSIQTSVDRSGALTIKISSRFFVSFLFSFHAKRLKHTRKTLKGDTKALRKKRKKKTCENNMKKPKKKKKPSQNRTYNRITYRKK